MTDATPRPWVHESAFRAHDANIHSGNPWTGESVWIATALGRASHNGFPKVAAAQANAALIVRAVNSHDALVSALEGLVSDRHDHNNLCPCPWCYARAALAAAKEPAP